MRTRLPLGLIMAAGLALAPGSVAMAKDPRRRFPSAVSFAHAFTAARRGKPVAIETPPNAWT